MHLKKIVILSLGILVSFLLWGETRGQSSNQDLNFSAYFPYFNEEGTQANLQILNTSDFESSFEVTFYSSKNLALRKSYPFELEAQERVDLNLSEFISFPQGSISIASTQSYVAQLALFNEEGNIIQTITPTLKSQLNTEGTAFEISLPASLAESENAGIYIFNPNEEKTKVTLQEFFQELSAEPRSLKSFSMPALASRLLSLTPYIEKGENLSWKLISSQPIAATVKMRQDKEERFIPLNPDLYTAQEEHSYQQYILPFFREGEENNFDLFLQNKDSARNKITLDICTRQEETNFYLQKKLALEEGSVLKLTARDLELDPAQILSLKELSLESQQDFTAWGICSLPELPLQTAHVPGLMPVPMEDRVPPDSPVLNRVITPTSINKQIISGSKDKDACLWLNNQPIIPFDDRATFSYELTLKEGKNPIQLTAKDRCGNESEPVIAAVILNTKGFSARPADPVEKDKDSAKNAVRGIPEEPLPFPYDNTAPALDPFASVLTEYIVKITYSEDMVGADQAANYSITPNLGTITVTALAGTLYRLRTELPAQPNVTYTIEVRNVTDQIGHPIDPDHDTAKFTGNVYGRVVLLNEFSGEGAFHYFGHAAASGGDINGDGFDDILLGAPGYSVRDLNAGRVYIYYGDPRDSTLDIFIDGENDDDQFGYAVSSAGDVNGDGYADFLAGAPYNDTNGNNAGQAYLYFGGGLEEINSVNPAADLKFRGESAGDNLGAFVASLGDINADGYADIFVGAPFNDSAAENAGAGYVYLGGTAMDEEPDLVLRGEGKWDYFGASAAGIGDFNRDGFGDFAVGAYANDQKAVDAGKVYFYFGGAVPDSIPDVVLMGENKGDYFGYSMAGAEVNGDTAVDLMVGAYANDQTALDAGKIYIYFALPSFNKQPNLVITGETAGDYFGYALSSAGDLDGDGQGDFLAGAYGYDGDTGNAGRVYGFYGGTVLDTVADTIMEGTSSRDYFGASVSSAGKFNEDDTAEILIGAKGADGAEEDSGKVYLMTANFGEKRPFVTDSNLVPRIYIGSDILEVELRFNEKIKQNSEDWPVIYFGKTYPYTSEYKFKCNRRVDDYACKGYYDLDLVGDVGFYVIKVSGGKNLNGVAMDDNAYYNFVFDDEPPNLLPNAESLSAREIKITYDESMRNDALVPNYYQITPGLTIQKIDWVLNTTSYILITSNQQIGTTYTITANTSEISDYAGNQLKDNIATVAAKDTTPPQVLSFDIFDLDTGDQEFTNSATVGVRMTESDQDSGVVKWLLTTSPVQPQPQDFILTARPTTYTLTGGNGPKDVYAWVLDQSNNVSLYTNASHDTIELDAQGPDIVLEPISPNPTLNRQITIEGQAAPGRDDDPADIHVDITGDILNSPVRVNVNPDFSFSADVTLSSGDGNKTVTATAFDKLNNPGDSDTQAVMLDTTPPAQPTLDPVTTPTNAAAITLTGTNTLDTEKVIVKLNGNNVNGVVYPSPSTWSVDLILAEGQNTIEVIAQDLADNTSAPVLVQALLDTTAPVIEMTYPVEGSVVNGKGL